jgi:hypothetical protein
MDDTLPNGYAARQPAFRASHPPHHALVRCEKKLSSKLRAYNLLPTKPFIRDKYHAATRTKYFVLSPFEKQQLGAV